MSDLPDPGPFLVRLMKAVAPEKGAALERQISDLGITFEIDENEDRIHFSADGDHRKIIVGLRCLGRLWANAFAYFCIYTDVADMKVRDLTAKELNLRSSERLRKAGDLLKWATNADVKIKLSQRHGIDAGDLSLPPGLPVPFSEAAFASDKHVADELSLMALGFILHHERVHIELGHTSREGFASIEQEKAADMRAAAWLLDSPGIEDDARLKRELGVAVGLGWLASLNVYVVQSGNETHPPGYDRVFQVLEQYVEDDNSPVWAFTMTLLSLHLENQQEPIPLDYDREFTSFKDAANYYIDVISRLGK
jgi:hypothetical protein